MVTPMTEECSSLDRFSCEEDEIYGEVCRLGASCAILVAQTMTAESHADQTVEDESQAGTELQLDLGAEAIAEHNGTIIRSHGGSSLAAFVEPSYALRAAADIQRRLAYINTILPEKERTQLRIGIHAVSEHRFHTDARYAVAIALELARKSGPAQIVISGSALSALQLDADLRSNWIERVVLPGSGRPEDIFEVIWTDTAAYRELRARIGGSLNTEGSATGGTDGEVRATGMAEAATDQGPETDSMRPPSDLPSLPARYEVLQKLGAGGMGIVYKAYDVETGEILALKVLRPELAADAAGLERFKNELRLARRVTHRNVCRIYDFNRFARTAFISMEFIEGDTLHQIVSERGRLGVEQGIGIARQICAALREAHLQHIIHRDLKPSNIMIDKEGNVKIMDFGIARTMDSSMTVSGIVLGTPAYMAPEQAEGKLVDARTDIYLLGLILYEMFTGAAAFRGDTPFLVALKQMREFPTSPREVQPDLPIQLESVVLRCLQKDPELRFWSVDELESALVVGEMPAQSPRDR